MLSASFQIPSRRKATPLRRRIGGIVFALAVELLLVVLLLTLNRRAPEPPRPAASPLSFQLIPAPERGGGEKAVKQAKAGQPKAAKIPAPVKPPPVPPVVPQPDAPPAPKRDLFPDLVRVDKDTLASSDIAKLPSTAPEGGGGNGKESVAAYGPSQGPGGQPLYNAEWVREPTQAELAFYLPPIKESGWALIACKTAPDNRVENCRTLGESPLGSGLSRGFREAAWQFRVYPPRVGGKKLIGAWVRIYYQLSVKTKAER